MISYAKIYKRYIALSLNYAKEAIMTNIIRYSFINGEINPTDILSKY